MSKRICAIDACTEPTTARGWCDRHYRRFLNHGDPLGGQPDSVVRYATNDELRDRLARGIDQIHNPVGLARTYLARRGLGHDRHYDELLDVAIDSIVDAALAWDPHGGRSILSWAWLYMDRNVARELGSARRRDAELRNNDGLSDAQWLRFDGSTDEYDRVELRVDLQRWADLAELTPLMRFIVDYAAHHHGTYVRDTPLEGFPTPLTGSGFSSYKRALQHMRTAAITGRRRDDTWTRRRNLAEDPAARRSDQLLERLRATEEARDRQLQDPTVAATG